jgi:hypothetical protein
VWVGPTTLLYLLYSFDTLPSLDLGEANKSALRKSKQESLINVSINVTCAGMVWYGVHGIAWWLTVDYSHVTML